MAEDILQRPPVVLAKTQADDMKLQINAVIKRLDRSAIRFGRGS